MKAQSSLGLPLLNRSGSLIPLFHFFGCKSGRLASAISITCKSKPEKSGREFRGVAVGHSECSWGSSSICSILSGADSSMTSLIGSWETKRRFRAWETVRGYSIGVVINSLGTIGWTPSLCKRRSNCGSGIGVLDMTGLLVGVARNGGI